MRSIFLSRWAFSVAALSFTLTGTPSTSHCQTRINGPEALGGAPLPTATPTPTPTNTPTPTSTSTPEPTIVPTVRPTATPTPTPTPRCDANVVTITHVHEMPSWWSGHGNRMFRSDRGNPRGALTEFYNSSCIQSILQRCMIPRGVAPQTVGFEVMYDDCVFLELANLKMQAVAPWRGATQCGSLTPRQRDCMRNGGVYNSGHRCRHIDSDPVRSSCANTPITLALDNNCNVIQQPDPARICGHFTALSIYTPISLMWREGIEIDSIKSLVSFALNPNEGAQWHDWRGSADTPLLVWDPAFSGKITSGAQLFGDWTWGGQSTASIDKLSSGTATAKWDNGYHALEQLDRDGDKRLSGDELAGISLWFDRNQNAVSEEGEVISAEKAGLKTLFVSPDSTDAVTHTIRASKGFERSVDGKLVSGASVDWYAEAAESKFDIIARQQNRKANEGTQSAKSDNETQRTASSVLTTTTAPFAGGDMTGVWLWTVKGEDATNTGNINGGLLFLTVDPDDGAVNGSSLIETPIENLRSEPRRVISRLQITGRLSGDGSKKEFTFDTRSGGKLLARSTARVLEDGTLEGRTTPEGGSVGTYEWVARR